MIELLALMRTTTAAQLLERDDFAKRCAAREPISMLELLYPLLQGYDSVAVDADVELGGTDQKFNLLLGRDIQRAYGQPEQAIMTMPILVGTDGHAEDVQVAWQPDRGDRRAEEMYGKTMSIPDEAMEEYYRLLLGATDPELPPASDPATDRCRQCRPGTPSARSRGDRGVAVLREAAQAQSKIRPRALEHAAPERDRGGALRAGEDGQVHLPGVIARGLRRLALGGTPADRPGRGDARRRAAREGRARRGRRSAPTARC